MALDQELEVASKPSYKFKIRPLVRPRVKLPGQVHVTPDARQDRSSLPGKAEEKRKKKPKWTKEMKQARDAAATAAAATASPAPIPRERNGLEKSPFNNIPGELRNKIYQLVLRVPGRVNLNAAYDDGQGGKRHRNCPGHRAWKGKAHFLALLSVSYQVRFEGTAAFYSCNEFILFTRFTRHGKPLEDYHKHFLTAYLRPARTWLKHIGEFNRSHLTSLEIDLDTWDTSKQARARDNRGWWTSALRTIAKQLLETGIDPQAVFVRVQAEMDIPGLNYAEMDDPCCPSSKMILGNATVASFKIPVVRDREAAKEAIEKGHQRQLKFMKRHPRHALTGKKPLAGKQMSRLLCS